MEDSNDGDNTMHMNMDYPMGGQWINAKEYSLHDRNLRRSKDDREWSVVLRNSID